MKKIKSGFTFVFECLSILSIFVLSPFLRTKLVSRSGCRVPVIPRGALLIANHQSRLDPFFIAYHIGMRNIYSNFPLSFPVASEYMRNIFLWLPMRMLGCFDVGETTLERAKGLLYIRYLLAEKKTVLIFPEGRIVKHVEPSLVFEKGITFLLQGHVPVVLIRLSGMNTWSFVNFTKRYQTKIVFGDVLGEELSLEEKMIRIKIFFEIT